MNEETDVPPEVLAEDHQLGALRVLARLIEYRSYDSEQHVEQVADLAGRLADALELPADQAERIRRAAPLHDIGMVVVPDSILLKGGDLSEKEREIMKTHTTNGARILAESDAPLFRIAREIALGHHERWDGDGYPQGLAGDAIPVSARIVAVADAYFAMTSDRPFRDAGSREEALQEIQQQAGAQFDPKVVDALLEVVEV